MIAQVSLHESVLKQVETGQSATIQVDALPGREFHGHVRFVSVMADQNSFWANPNLRLYRTEVTIDDATSEMRPGMSCAIEILVEEIQDTLFAPVQSVFRRGKENLAFVDAGGGTAERKVEVGRYNDRWVQVLSGLSEGEVVLLAPPPGFTREVEETEAPEMPGPGAARMGGAAVAQQAPGKGPPAAGGDDGAGGEKRGERGQERQGQGSDSARAEEFRKRFENMSEEERAKAMEAFRNRRGGEGGREEGRSQRGAEAGKGG
jgi:hypothetical protein